MGGGFIHLAYRFQSACSLEYWIGEEKRQPLEKSGIKDQRQFIQSIRMASLVLSYMYSDHVHTSEYKSALYLACLGICFRKTAALCGASTNRQHKTAWRCFHYKFSRCTGYVVFLLCRQRLR